MPSFIFYYIYEYELHFFSCKNFLDPKKVPFHTGNLNFLLILLLFYQFSQNWSFRSSESQNRLMIRIQEFDSFCYSTSPLRSQAQILKQNIYYSCLEWAPPILYKVQLCSSCYEIERNLVFAMTTETLFWGRLLARYYVLA